VLLKIFVLRDHFHSGDGEQCSKCGQLVMEGEEFGVIVNPESFGVAFSGLFAHFGGLC